MAFDEDQGHGSLSRKFDLHHKTVVRNTLCVAEAYLRRQDEWLKGVLDMARSGGIRPLCVCSCRKWDETKEKVSLETLTDATREAQTDCVDCMVSSMRVVICFPNSTVVVCTDLVCAPAPLLSSSSDNLAAALWNHPWLAKMQENVDQLHTLAVWSSHVNECDGASGNDKLHYSTTSTQSCRSISSCNCELSVCSSTCGGGGAAWANAIEAEQMSKASVPQRGRQLQWQQWWSRPHLRAYLRYLRRFGCGGRHGTTSIGSLGAPGDCSRSSTRTGRCVNSGSGSELAHSGGRGLQRDKEHRETPNTEKYGMTETSV